jgi:hypothetical protein
MEKRIFGCPEFSDIIFNSSLCLFEKILDFVLDDQLEIASSSASDRTFKIGFYANETQRCLDVMVETFENEKIY